MSFNKIKGAEGERLAADYLQEKLNFVIIDRNVRSLRAELDIVAIKDNELRFIEVKSRMHHAVNSIMSSLEQRKLKQLTKGAADYLNTNRIQGITEVYFDLVTVIFNEDGGHEIEYTPSFFYPTW
ncbi:MAG: YraN family protein [Rikenellaceae bacterium]